MDPRHISHKLNLLNQIINLINTYCEEKLDELIVKGELQADLKSICESVYRCAHLWKDTDALLSKRNWLSIDPVPLPSIHADTVLDEDAFQAMFKQLETLIEKKRSSNSFYESLLILFKTYKQS